MIFGNNRFKYEVVDDWLQLPEKLKIIDVCGVAVDSQDRVYLFSRTDQPVLIFDREGKYLNSWGEGIFTSPHSLRVGPDDSVYCVDDGNHTVRKFTFDGRLQMILGNKDRPSDTGGSNEDYRTVKRGGEPFNSPTDIAFAPSGEIYISDGYGNARVHKFSPAGKLLFSWGEPGTDPGQFNVPHSVCVDRHGIVYVADRENNRIQLFTQNGEFKEQWTNVNRPAGLFIDVDNFLYVAELGYRYGLWPWMRPPTPKSPLPCVSIWSLDGKLQTRWGGVESCLSGNFASPHMLCTDSRSDLYVGEVVYTVAGSKGLLPIDCHVLQKFTRTGT